MPLRKFEKIFIHCSDSEFGHALMIDQWHRDRGWSKIGYGLVVNNGYPGPTWMNDKKMFPGFEGSIEIGRLIDSDKIFEAFEKQAGIYGHNTASYHICIVGKSTFSDKVLNSTLDIVRYLCAHLEVSYDNVFGHYEMDNKKTCPNFNVYNFRRRLKESTRYGQPAVNVEIPKKKETFLNKLKKFFKDLTEGH